MQTSMSMMPSKMEELGSFWVACMLAMCVLNGVTALVCVVFVLQSNAATQTAKTESESNRDDDVSATSAATTLAAVANNKENQEEKASMRPRCIIRQDAVELDESNAQDTVCGKRKMRDQVIFPFASQPTEVEQGRWKQRRIAKISIASRLPRRARSLGDDERDTVNTVPLRRVVSCEDVAALRRLEAIVAALQPVEQVVDIAAPREIRLKDVVSSAVCNLTAIVTEKLQEAARNAVDEVLTTVISFLTYGVLLFVVRQYSAVAVGVSLDLGAFSIEL